MLLFHQTLGFDNLFESFLDNDTETLNSVYSPYNIEKHSEDNFCISMVVAGFDIDDLNITEQNNLLIVSGKKGNKIF